MISRLLIVLFYSVFWIGVAFSQSSNIQSVKVISDAAQATCEHIAQSGNESTEIFKGDVKAGVSDLLRKLIDAGASGSIEVNKERYEGVLQKDLMSALQSADACRLAVVQTLVPYMLHKDEDQDKISRKLVAGNQTVEPGPCGPLLPGELAIMMGSNEYATNVFPHVVLNVRGNDLLTMIRHEDNSLGINLDVYGSDGRLVEKIVDNLITVNVNNYSEISQRDGPRSMSVTSKDNLTTLNVEYLNEAVVRITGKIRFGDVSIDLVEAATHIGGGGTISESCLRNNGVDLRID